MEKDEKGFKHIVRVVNTDLDGNKGTMISLRKIKGINFGFANFICTMAKIDKNKKIGYIKDEDVKKINNVIKNPIEYGAPAWMLNRQKDYETGQNSHIITGEIMFVQENDIKIQKKIKSYIGVRHSQGLPVRGQRTKSNFRKNKGKVTGVKRKSKKTGKT